MRKIIISVLIFSISAAINFPLIGDTVFSDDFQSEEVDQDPTRWMNITPDPPRTTGIIAEDPQDAGNLTMKITALDATNVLVADMEDLPEYTAEWDWMWESGWQTIAIHTQENGDRYHLGVEANAGVWEMWSWNSGAWGGPFVTNPFPQEANVWHSFQLIVNQAHIILKTKERDDTPQFDQLDPIIEMDGEDTAYTSGKFGIADGPISYIDNVVIYIGSKAITPVGRLSVTWAKLKAWLPPDH